MAGFAFSGVMLLATILDLMKTLSCGGSWDCGFWGPNHLRGPVTFLLTNRILQVPFVEFCMPQGSVLHFLLRLNLHEPTYSECCSFFIDHCRDMGVASMAIEDIQCFRQSFVFCVYYEARHGWAQ